MRKPKLITGPSLEARMQIEQLQKDLAESRSYAADLQKSYNAGRAEVHATRDEIKTTREQFADLKKRLHDAEIENSRLNGYMQRVREDDNVADPLVEIEDAGGKRQVSKRWPSNGHMQNSANGCNADFATDDYGRRGKREHWTAY